MSCRLVGFADEKSFEWFCLFGSYFSQQSGVAVIAVVADITTTTATTTATRITFA